MHEISAAKTAFSPELTSVLAFAALFFSRKELIPAKNQFRKLILVELMVAQPKSHAYKPAQELVPKSSTPVSNLPFFSGANFFSGCEPFFSELNLESSTPVLSFNPFSKLSSTPVLNLTLSLELTFISGATSFFQS